MGMNLGKFDEEEKERERKKDCRFIFIYFMKICFFFVLENCSERNFRVDLWVEYLNYGVDFGVEYMNYSNRERTYPV